MPAPTHNRHAARGSENASAQLQVRCIPREKSAWVRAAQARTARDPALKPALAAWVVDTLNSEAARELKPRA